MGHQQLSQSSPGGQLLDLWEKASSRGIFSELTTLKNANLCIFGHKITGLAYFKPIRYLVYVPHGSSIAALVFIMTLAAGPRGASSSNFFFIVSYFANCQLACLEPENYCFPTLSSCGYKKKLFMGYAHFFQLSAWPQPLGFGDHTPKRSFFLRANYLEKCWFALFWSQNHHSGPIWAH